MTPPAPPETLLRTPPETKLCVRCRVQINAASGYCTLCGAVQRVRRRGTRWLIAAGAVVAIGGAAALGVVLLGDSGGGTSRSQFRRFQTGQLATLVPVGWSGGPAPAGPGASRAIFTDPADSRRLLSVIAERAAPVSALVRARAARSLARSHGAYQQDFFGHVRFSDGRPVWLLSYESAGSAHAVYLYSTCVPTVAMTVDLRAPTRADLKASFKEIPASAGARC